MRRPTRVGVILLVATFLLPPRSVRAEDVESCADAYEAAQRLRKKGQLLASKERLLYCVRESCPAVARSGCAEWLRDVERDMPTVVVSVRGTGGRDTDAAEIYLDGSLIDSPIGRAIEIDPGRHVLRYLLDGRVLEESIVIAEGEKNRRAIADFSIRSEAPEPNPSGRQEGSAASPSRAPWILGGVAALSLGAFGYFGISGLRGQECAPTCSRDEVDGIRRDFLVADVALGVGVVAAVAAVVIALTEPRAAH